MKNRIVPIHSLVRSIVEKYYNEAKEIQSDYLFNDINILKLIVGHEIGDLTEHVYTHRELNDSREEMELIKND